MHSSQAQQLKAACLRGDAAAAKRLLAGQAAFGCLCDGSPVKEQALAGVLLGPLPADDGSTLLHHLAIGEALGIGGCLLFSLAGGSPRGAAGGGPAVWPSKHQRGRAQVLAALLAQQPRLVLLAGSRNAAGHTPLHCCVLSRSWQVLALLLAAMQQLLPPAGAEDSQQQQSALQLLLSIPDAAGLSALELAIKLRQWPAARLLSAAAGPGLPLSRDQIAACSLVNQYVRLNHYSSSYSLASSSGAAADEQQGIRVSASGATVTEALGGLLSKLWDAFSAAPAEEAAIDQLAAAARLEGSQLSGDAGDEGSSSSNAAGAATTVQAQQVGPLRLQPKAVCQADVVALVLKAEQQAADCAAPAAGEAAAPGPAAAIMEEATAAEGAGDATPLKAISSSTSSRHCIVCYEDVPAGKQSVQLACGHCTCNTCWRGILQASIDEGDPRRAACPEPGCCTALPSATAARLLSPSALERYQLLVAQRYAIAHPQQLRSCPQAGCSTMLLLPVPSVATQPRYRPASATAAGADVAAIQHPEGAAAGGVAAAAVAAAAAPGAGLDAECGACGHLLCWRCGEEAHEPASCAQMRRWGEELAELRAAAPNADMQWLTSHTKRCPQCRARIQKQGGCNHMACKGCGHHFCWVCGRAWAQHSESTGGFFYCNLEQHHELPEYSVASSGTSEAGSLGGPLAWLAGVWGSIKAAAQQQQLQRHLRQYLRLSGSRGALFASAAQMQRLLAAAGVAANADSSGGSCGSSKCGEGGVLGPEVLGVSSSEAARMSDLEWAQLVAAAAASAADAAVQLRPFAGAAAKSAAEAALTTASNSSSSNAAGNSAYLLHLAEGVAAARGLLQHSAVALYQLPLSNHRRHLQQLTAAIQVKLDQLEPLLLSLPEREALPPAPSGWQAAAAQLARPGSSGNGAGSMGATRGHGGSGSSGGGFAGWLLHKWYGVESGAAYARRPDSSAPECHPAIASLSPEVLLQQAQFAAAVHQQRQAVQAMLRALWSDVREMHAAARAGLFAC